jgi:hypothetical protein
MTMSLTETRANGLDCRRLGPFLLIAALAACGAAEPPQAPPPPPVTGTVTGTVRSSVDGGAVAGATVSIRNHTTTSGADGGFRLEGVATGPATLNSSRSGFEQYSAGVNIQAGVNTHDVMLSLIEVYAVGTHVIYVPARVPTIHGVIVVIGGPDTRCMADARLTCAMPDVDPDVTISLRQLGSSYRMLAASRGLAVIGGPAVVEDVVNALSLAATVTQRPELATAPFLAHGMYGGGPGAYRLAMNNPGRAAGLILRASPQFTLVDPAPTRSMPALLVTAEADDASFNSFNSGVYTAHRSAGGLWAFAQEPGALHVPLSSALRDLYMSWIVPVLEQRLPATPGGQLRTIDDESGWLGNPVTFAIAPWGDYTGDRSIAAWLPSAGSATNWQRLVQP